MKRVVASLIVFAAVLAAWASKPPDDAVVLFDGTQKSFDANWTDMKGRKAKWTCADGTIEATRSAGDIRTRREFGDVQLHVEWQVPAKLPPYDMNSGNSGVFMMGLYEVQIFESYETDPADMKHPFYADGQAAAIYGQNPPLVNPARRRGEWQTYDIVFYRPVFDGEKCVRPGSVTVFMNGVLVQDGWPLEGPTGHIRRTRQTKPHSVKGPVKLQQHLCPVRFRNIWIRELPETVRASRPLPYVCEYRKGVTLKRLVLEKPRRMVAHVARVDLTVPGISFTGTERDPLWGKPMPDYTNETWLVNTKRETAADFMMRRRGEGRNVEIAVNTSGWRPWGGAGCNSTYAALYRYAASEGMEVSHGKDPERGVFFVVRKDGQVLIRPHVPVSMTNDVAIAMYGNRRILRRGVRTVDADTAKAIDVHPRTAFGLSQDRKTFVILAVDGRQPGYSEGATYADLADLLLREGCADAINMDGGGSTSLVIYDREHNRPFMLNHHANGYVRKTALNLGLIFPANGQ